MLLIPAPVAQADSVVHLKPGTYTRGIDVPAGTVVQGAPGVVFDGRRAISPSGTGRLRSAAYRPIPVQDGHGIAFQNGQNCRRFVCRHADQAWSGDRLLKQTSRKKWVRPGYFWVGEGRIWFDRTDARAKMRVSQDRAFGTIRGTLRDVTIIGFSANAADGAVVRVNGGTLEGVTIRDSAMVAVQATGSSILRDVTIDRAGWMGVSAAKCSRLVIDNASIQRINLHRDFATVPQSGALKTSRCRNISISDTQVRRVVGHGLWFDQSTADTQITGTSVDRVDGRALFYEISHGLTTQDSTFASTETSKFAGASGVRLGSGSVFDPGYRVLRERRNCPDPRTPLCLGALKSDRAWPYDPRITWRNDVRWIS